MRSAIPDAVPEPQGAAPPPAFPPPAEPAPEPGPPPSGFPPPPGGGAAPAPYGQQAMAAQGYPIDLDAGYPSGGIARWRCFFQYLMLIPHFFVLWFVIVGAYFAFIYSWFAIVFTGSYPRGAFNFIAGAVRWATRVGFFAYLMTERYPPFSTGDDPDYPARVRIDYPDGGIARWRPFLQWLLAIPHLIVLWFVGVAVAFAIIYAWFVILFTRRYPSGVFEFVAGALRWSTRVNAYNLLMTERYPPFSLR
jgi:hypothetical protein